MDYFQETSGLVGIATSTGCKIVTLVMLGSKELLSADLIAALVNDMLLREYRKSRTEEMHGLRG